MYSPFLRRTVTDWASRTSGWAYQRLAVSVGCTALRPQFRAFRGSRAAMRTARTWRVIVTTFGVDSLLPATIDPAAFLRAFAAAEPSAGRASPFGPEAMHVVGMLEQRYWSRGSASGCAAVFDFALTREVRCSPACRLPCKTM